MLQAGQRFAAAAFAPVLLNLVLIAALLVTRAEVATRRMPWPGASLAAGVLQLAWVAVAARRAGSRRRSAAAAVARGAAARPR